MDRTTILNKHTHCDKTTFRGMMYSQSHQNTMSCSHCCFFFPVKMDSDENKPVNPKGNQLWVLTGRTDAEAPILWPHAANSWLIGKDPNAGKDWRQREKRATEDEMVGWHHRFNGHELGQTPGDGEGQGSPPCCSPWGREELDTTWWLNNTNN